MEGKIPVSGDKSLLYKKIISAEHVEGASLTADIQSAASPTHILQRRGRAAA